MTQNFITLSLPQIQKLQTPGAEKSPEKLLQEQTTGQTTFVERDGKIFRLVSSVTMILMSSVSGQEDHYWHEFGQYKFDPKTQIWNFKQRKYPFPGEGIENHEPPKTALERGLREEFGLSLQNDISQIITPLLLASALQVTKPSLTAGFKTIYQFFPFQIFLKPGVEITSSLPSNFPHQIPKGEIWRLDASVSGGPQKVLCFKSIPFPENWKELLLTI